MSSGVPVPCSPPPCPQECAEAEPEAAVAPRVSWAQLSQIRPGPAGRSPAWDAPHPPFLPRGWRVGPSKLWAQQWRAPGGEVAGLGWAWGRGAETRSILPNPFLLGPGLGGSASVNHCFCLLSIKLFPAPKPCESGGLMAEESPWSAWTPTQPGFDPPEDSDLWASLETQPHLLALAAAGGGIHR